MPRWNLRVAVALVAAGGALVAALPAKPPSPKAAKGGLRFKLPPLSNSRPPPDDSHGTMPKAAGVGGGGAFTPQTQTGMVLVVCESTKDPGTGKLTFHEYTVLDPMDGSTGTLLILPAGGVAGGRLTTFDTVTITAVDVARPGGNGNDADADGRRRRGLQWGAGGAPPRLRHLPVMEVQTVTRVGPPVPRLPDGTLLMPPTPPPPAVRRRRALHVGGRTVLAFCVSMTNLATAGLTTPGHCGEASVRAVFSANGGGAAIDGFFQFATHGTVSFPPELLTYANVTTSGLNTSMACHLPSVSAAADAAALDLGVALEKQDAVCIDSELAPHNGHAYNSPERCAARCMCNVAYDAPSGVRHFSLYLTPSGGYACYCGLPTSPDKCPAGRYYQPYAGFTSYTFKVGPAATVSEEAFCAAGNHRLYLIPHELSSCTFAAAAYVCGDDADGPCHLYSRYNDGFALSHELGHNLGLVHAGADVGNDGGALVTTDEVYGDVTDVMGYGGYRFAQSFNAPHRITLGLLPPSHIMDLAPGGPVCSTTVEMLPLHVDPALQAGTQLVRFPRSAVRGGGMYHVTFRVAEGYDDGLVDSLMDGKVHVHYTPNDDVERLYGVDALLVGVATFDVPFHDTDTGVTIRAPTDPCGGGAAAAAAVEIDFCGGGPTVDSPFFPDGHTFGGYEVVGSGKVCFPAATATHTFGTAAGCAAACRNRCGCAGFSWHTASGYCHLSDGPACCRDGLGTPGDLRYNHYRLVGATGALCPRVAVEGIPGFEGTFSVDPTWPRCHEVLATADGRTVRWRPDLRRWCFRRSDLAVDDNSTVCHATSPGAADDFTVGAGARFRPEAGGVLGPVPGTPVAHCLDPAPPTPPGPGGEGDPADRQMQCTTACRRGARPI